MPGRFYGNYDIFCHNLGIFKNVVLQNRKIENWSKKKSEIHLYAEISASLLDEPRDQAARDELEAKSSS